MAESEGENNCVSSDSGVRCTCRKNENEKSECPSNSRGCNHDNESSRNPSSKNNFSCGQFTNSFNKICVKEKLDRSLKNPFLSGMSDCLDKNVNSSLQSQNTYDTKPESKSFSKMSDLSGHSHSRDSLCSGASSSSGEKLDEESIDKYLIFTMGSETYTPHQVGIKLIKSIAGAESVRTEQSPEGLRLLPEVEDNNHGLDRDDYDSVDHLIDLHGHIIGMSLSPDHR